MVAHDCDLNDFGSWGKGSSGGGWLMGSIGDLDSGQEGLQLVFGCSARKESEGLGLLSGTEWRRSSGKCSLLSR